MDLLYAWTSFICAQKEKPAGVDRQVWLLNGEVMTGMLSSGIAG